MKHSISPQKSQTQAFSAADYEEYLESIIDTIREALLILDKDHRIISANKTFYHQFKVKPERTENLLLYELGNGQWNIPQLRKLLEELLPTHNPFNNFRVEHDFPTIGKRVMLLNARQIKRKGRWKDRILLAIADITDQDKDRKEKEADVVRERTITKELQHSKDELIKSELKFRTLADNIPNLAWMARADGHIFWYNSRWYEYTGLSEKESIGWEWKKAHDPNVLPIVQKKWEYSLQTSEPFEMVFPLKDSEGNFRPFLTRIVPIKDKKGKVLQWFGTNTDITKQVELERQKDEFLGIASHELKTPVTSIKAYGQVLLTVFQRNGDTKAVEKIKKMDAQVNKLTSLIGDLLDVTKIHSSRLEFHEEYFDFNELMSEIVDEMQLTTEKQKLIKKFDTTKTLYGDRDRIGQVLTNLISNAMKYSLYEKKIIIRTKVTVKKITVSVQDFGVGIPKEKQEKVFEQFFRVSGPKHATVPGLGLGLYISSEIIKRQGGRIWVESQEGKGSTFYFSLPLTNKKKTKEKNTLVEEEIQHE